MPDSVTIVSTTNEDLVSVTVNETTDAISFAITTDETIVNVSVTDGQQGPPGPPGAPGAASPSFETVFSNHAAYPVTASGGDNITSRWRIYTAPAGMITATTNYSSGVPFTKVLSGVGVPSGIAFIKTYDWSGGTAKPPLISYS